MLLVHKMTRERRSWLCVRIMSALGMLAVEATRRLSLRRSFLS